MNRQFIKTHLPFFAFYFLIVFFTFQFLPRTFFQQDEWAIFGNYLYWEKAHLSWFERLFVFQQYTHLIPLSNLLSYLQFSLFHLNFSPYALSSVLIHFVNSCLVYVLGYILFKKRILAFLGGIFFMVNSISQQAVTWIATATGTEGATLFILLSVIFFTKYILNDKAGKKYLWLSLFFTLISLAFKETSLFIFLFLPIYAFIFKTPMRKIKAIIISILAIGILYILIRAIFVFAFANLANTTAELTQPTYLTYAYRILTMPLKVLAQSLIPASFIIQAGGYLIRLSYPQFVAIDNAPNPFIVESVGADIISFGFAFILIVLTFLMYLLWRQKRIFHLASVLLASLLFIVLSSLPFIFVPGRAGFLSLIDGRHLYLTGIFTSILLVSIIYGIYEILPVKRIAVLILSISVLLFTLMNVFQIRDNLAYQVKIGHTRKQVLREIFLKYPHPSKNVVFYIESDKSFYGVEGNILPFQSGLGQTLLVWYNMHGEIFPACFFNDQFLYVQLSQEYRECEGSGFGYFREIDKLENFMKENKINENEIIAFQYISSEEKLVDITKNIQAKITK